jgi:sulfur carrier protein
LSPVFIFGGVAVVKVNGIELDIAGKTLAEYLETTNYELKRIAVECNGEIVFKANYESTILKDDDCLEIVCFVGGG